MKRPTRITALAAIALALLVGCTNGAVDSGLSRYAGASGGQAASAEPPWSISEVAGGLSYPWDVTQTPDGTVIFTERGGEIGIIRNHNVNLISADLQDVFVEGETGLMGIVADPSFEETRRFYTCYASIAGSDVRVVAWTMAEDYESAKADPQPLVQGIPRAQSGRHSGCRLRFDVTGALQIGTGDSTSGSAPQSPTSLGGKTLRVDPKTGEAPKGNPFLDYDNPQTRLIYTYGHRNVQGLAVQPKTGLMYSVEHGPDVDDEINIIAPKANYGWNPNGPGSLYDEGVPMTDAKIENVTAAVWSSGDATLATSGATFLGGQEWGEFDGALIIATLNGKQLLVFDIDAKGHLYGVKSVAAFNGTYGRLRTAQVGTQGSFFVTTSNGQGDVILEVTPK